MLDAILHIITFLLEAIISVAAILIVIAGIFAIAAKSKAKLKDKLRAQKLNDHYLDMTETLNDEILSKVERKQLQKAQKKEKKQVKKSTPQRNVFVLEFNGDIKASAVKSLREEISAILMTAKKEDEVLLKLESAGGVIHGYGLAASQLQRLKDAGIHLTAAVDKVAASGGYMMACVADKIIAAPFSIIGSIGVVAQIPNFHRLLKKKDIDFEQITAGEYKRTMSIFAENTESGREKFQEDINEAHDLFKQFVSDHKPHIDINKVSTGEHWFAIQAKDLGLVDELSTSDDYLLQLRNKANLVKINFHPAKNLRSKFSQGAQAVTDKVLASLWWKDKENAKLKL